MLSFLRVVGVALCVAFCSQTILAEAAPPSILGYYQTDKEYNQCGDTPADTYVTRRFVHPTEYLAQVRFYYREQVFFVVVVARFGEHVTQWVHYAPAGLGNWVKMHWSEWRTYSAGMHPCHLVGHLREMRPM
jgi:hypothetical protein